MSQSDVALLVETLLGVATVLACVWVAVPGRWPWGVVADSVVRAATSWRRALYLGALLAILVLNRLYLALGIDERCTAWVVARRGTDFATLIHRHIEGDAVAHLQRAVAWLPLTWLLGYVYVVAFPCLVFVAVLVFDHRRDGRGLALVLAAYLLNFALVLPLYVCVPVREAFVYYQELGLREPAVRLLLDDISPAIMAGYRSMSGVDNCFPSFHTSLAATLALVAWRGGRRLGWVVTVLAAAVVVSTVYLGVHWLTDVAAGLVVAAAACALAWRLARRWQAPAREPR
jgi:membrane-associated phospholipid phosphatase